MSWQDALERTISGLHYDLVDIERSAGGLLRITIDRLPGQVYSTGPGLLVLVEDCEVVTRQLQYLLEVENVDYQRLEVSSPGLDRPIKKLADWQRFVGVEVEVTLREPFQNRRKWRGLLAAGADDSAWRLVLQPEAPAGRGRSPSRAAAKPKPGAEPMADQVLDFHLEEVREARLVPVVDFKGRRAAGSDGLDRGPAGVAEKVDGGRD